MIYFDLLQDPPGLPICPTVCLLSLKKRNKKPKDLEKKKPHQNTKMKKQISKRQIKHNEVKQNKNETKSPEKYHWLILCCPTTP